MKLTKTTVARLALPRGKVDHIVFDGEVKGFGVRLRAGGKRSWIVQYRVGAKQRRVTLGAVETLDADKAREAARNRLAQVTLGGDPQADKVAARARAAETLGAAVETYLASKRDMLRSKSFKESERYLRKSWRPLHGLPLHKIDRRAVATRLNDLTIENGPVAATRARAALSTLMVWAMRQGLLDHNITIGTERPAKAWSRDRVLSEGELGEIWNACRDDDHGRVIRLLMLTGARRQEIGGLSWSEVNIERGVISLPADRTKNARPHTIPLSAPALAIISAMPRRERDGHLFGDGGTGFQGWSKAKASLDRRILASRTRAAEQFRRPVDDTMVVPSWQVHDLRRSVATHMAELGVQPHVIEALLNHVSGHKAGVAGTYNRAVYEREVLAALVLWADHLRTIVDGTDRKVVAFGARQI
jgi:integrase